MITTIKLIFAQFAVFTSLELHHIAADYAIFRHVVVARISVQCSLRQDRLTKLPQHVSLMMSVLTGCRLMVLPVCFVQDLIIRNHHFFWRHMYLYIVWAAIWMSVAVCVGIVVMLGVCLSLTGPSQDYPCSSSSHFIHPLHSLNV